MRAAILGFVAGAVALQQAAGLPTCAGIAVLVLASLLLRRWAHGAISGALIGYAWAAALALAALAPQLAKEDEGTDIIVTGTIATMPFASAGGLRFNMEVERSTRPVPPLITLAWFAGRGRQQQEVGMIKPGERWQLHVRLQRPHGTINPGGFDYEVWLLEQGVRATGYVRADAQINRRIGDFVWSATHVIERCRMALRDRILTALPGRRYAGVIVALVVGEQRGIAQSDWQVFNRTGIGHLISISGLHITMIAGLAAFCVNWAWRRGALPLLLPAQKAAALVGALVALGYVLLAGFGPPAQRTLYMLSVVAIAMWSGRMTSVSHVLCIALGIVVLLDPWAVLWPGFWLSFVAVATILYASVGRTAHHEGGWRAALRDGARVQYAVTLGLAPLTMLLFAQVSLVSPLANAFAIPLVSFVVTPLALLGAVTPSGLSEWLLLAAHGCVQALAWLLARLADAPFATWSAPTPGPIVFCAAVAGVLWMLAPRGWPLSWLGLFACVPLAAAAPQHAAPATVSVTAFDVGQGMALLIETSGHRLLYDTGPGYGPQSDAGSRVLLPYLRYRGIGHLDGMIVTHSDTDHSGGALSVLESMRVDWVASSLGPAHAIARAARRHIACAAGQRWEWDGVRFEMLHPQAASYADPSLKPNARGCTLRVTAGGRAMLLAADIEAAQEAVLVAAGVDLRADVLLAPHHGSGTSSTPAFLAAVQPQVTLFQVGYRNRYHHPRADVFARYGALGIERIRTDEVGSVQIGLGPELRIERQRVDQQRYWYAR